MTVIMIGLDWIELDRWGAWKYIQILAVLPGPRGRCLGRRYLPTHFKGYTKEY